MRIFIAVELSDEMRSEIEQYMKELRKNGVTGRYTPPANLHTTLAFIGETNDLPKIRDAVKAVRFEPFEIGLSEPGMFRDILWMGLAGEEKLAKLSEALCRELNNRGINFDRKPYKAHITLVRQAEFDKLPKPRASKAVTAVKEIAVIKSERINGRLTYSRIL